MTASQPGKARSPIERLVDQACTEKYVPFTTEDLRKMPNGQLADCVLSAAIGCSDVEIARILKEASKRLRSAK